MTRWFLASVERGGRTDGGFFGLLRGGRARRGEPERCEEKTLMWGLLVEECPVGSTSRREPGTENSRLVEPPALRL